MMRRDRRFRTYRTYVAYGVTWTRHVDLAEGTMTWTCRRSLHPVRIERDRRGIYRLWCDEHRLFAKVHLLRRAFRVAAVHMGYETMRTTLTKLA